jgi:hypothetical protein
MISEQQWKLRMHPSSHAAGIFRHKMEHRISAVPGIGAEIIEFGHYTPEGWRNWNFLNCNWVRAMSKDGISKMVPFEPHAALVLM